MERSPVDVFCQSIRTAGPTAVADVPAPVNGAAAGEDVLIGPEGVLALSEAEEGTSLLRAPAGGPESLPFVADGPVGGESLQAVAQNSTKYKRPRAHPAVARWRTRLAADVRSGGRRMRHLTQVEGVTRKQRPRAQEELFVLTRTLQANGRAIRSNACFLRQAIIRPNKFAKSSAALLV
jgi:hypothetical protein